MSAPVLTGSATASGEIQIIATTGGNYADVSFAAIDPFIQIDPAFLAANPGYSIIVSDGVGNSPDVSSAPEPASLALTGATLLGLFAMRRKYSQL